MKESMETVDLVCKQRGNKLGHLYEAVFHLLDNINLTKCDWVSEETILNHTDFERKFKIIKAKLSFISTLMVWPFLHNILSSFPILQNSILIYHSLSICSQRTTSPLQEISLTECKIYFSVHERLNMIKSNQKKMISIVK